MTETKKNVDLGIIISDTNGSLKEYKPSQFVIDTAKHYEYLRLVGYIFPESEKPARHATCRDCKYYGQFLNPCNQCEHNELFESNEKPEEHNCDGYWNNDYRCSICGRHISDSKTEKLHIPTEKEAKLFRENFIEKPECSICRIPIKAQCIEQELGLCRIDTVKIICKSCGFPYSYKLYPPGDDTQFTGVYKCFSCKYEFSLDENPDEPKKKALYKCGLCKKEWDMIEYVRCPYCFSNPKKPAEIPVPRFYDKPTSYEHGFKDAKNGSWNEDIKNNTESAKYWKGFKYGLQTFWGDFICPEKEKWEARRQE